MISSCSVIIRKPMGAEAATLGVRAAWAMFTNASLDVSIILMGDGVYSALGKDGYIKQMYERFIGQDGNVYAVQEDLQARGVDAKTLPQGVSVIPASQVSGLVEDSDSIMTF